jgi:flagellar protein FliO/FliZ|tara:strand:- start:269 stop:571 length:303 start_codon:yes stop_codon:yes gene_type:complete
MEFSSYIRFLLALVFVLGLIGMFAVIARRMGFGFPNTVHKKSANRQLSVEEVLSLDGRRKLFLIRRNNTEHLILLGPNSETIVENNIKVPMAQTKPEDIT